MDANKSLTNKIHRALVDSKLLSDEPKKSAWAHHVIKGVLNSTARPFTVIGYYQDNNQSFVGHFVATSAKKARELALDADQECDAGQLAVLSVIAGIHDDLNVEA